MFRKGVSRVESAFFLTREKLVPNRSGRTLEKVVARKALKGGGDSEKRAREDQNWFNADLSQKLRFRESPPRDKWSQ